MKPTILTFLLLSLSLHASEPITVSHSVTSGSSSVAGRAYADQNGLTIVNTGTNSQTIEGQRVFHSSGLQDSPIVGNSESGASAGIFIQGIHFNQAALTVQRTGTAGGEGATSPTLLLQSGLETTGTTPVMQIGGCLALSGDNWLISWGDGALSLPGGILDNTGTTKGRISIDPVHRQLVAEDGITPVLTWTGTSVQAVNLYVPADHITGLGSAAVTSSTAYATHAQGITADAALPASNGLAVNTTLTGTTGIRASGTGVAPFQIYQDPANGSMVWAMPAGAMSFYADGSGTPIMVFNGQIQCNDIVANLNVSSSIDAGIITTGYIPLARLPSWAANFSTGYPGWGVLAGTPANVPYFFSWTSSDSSGSSQTVAYRTASQIKTDMAMLTASGSITWPAISSATTSTQTLTVTGAVPASTPSVHLGWSAALPVGLQVAQAWVSATNTVSISLRNNTGSTITPSAITVRATVHMP